MCGIFGLVSCKDAVPILIEGLARLEYRGYDSCGIATLNNKSITVCKDKGEIKEVRKTANLDDLHGVNVLGHTRWATHGPPTQINSHPHTDAKANFAIVHNGIIENYVDLKEELISKGYEFKSATDSEVIVHLISEAYASKPNLEQAIKTAISKLEGTYAIGVISVFEPDVLYAVRKESPLIIGISEDYRAIASDVQAFGATTSQIVYIEEGEMIKLTKDSYEIADLKGQKIERAPEPLEKAQETSLGGHPDYMSKEIAENAKVIEEALKVPQADIDKVVRAILQRGVGTTYFTGMGTAYYVAVMAQYLFARIAGRYFPAVSADELFYLGNDFGVGDTLIAMSQSGETYDTLKTLRAAKKKSAMTMSITNVPTSSMAREVDFCIQQNAGPEICVLSTKSTISQLFIMLRIAIELAGASRKLSSAELVQYRNELKKIPKQLQQMLDTSPKQVIEVARKHANTSSWFFLGREFYHGLALEAALKFKEITYHHAEGMPAGMLKHGVISLIEPSINTIMFMPSEEESELRAQCLGAAAEIRARKGTIIALQPEGMGNPEGLFDDIIEYPRGGALLAPFLALTQAQLFAYFTAKTLKRNIDRPRALAKSVTVG